MHPADFIRRQIAVLIEVFRLNKVAMLVILICSSSNALFVQAGDSILVKIDFFYNSTIFIQLVPESGNSLFVSCGNVISSFLESFFYNAAFRVSHKTHIADFAAFCFQRHILGRFC